MKTCGLILLFALLLACSEKPASFPANRESRLPDDPVIVPSKDYQKQLAAIRIERDALYAQYRNDSQNAEAVENARQAFVRSIYKDIIPYWYETEWDFYGTSETPKQGKIACGYFVTTVLRDAGLKVERVKLAQQASEKIILSLTGENHVKRFRNAKIENFVKAIEKWGVGLYVVGLDFHVGFIVNDGARTYFIHSSYVEPRRVVRENALDSQVLASSKYRIAGKISDDDELLAKWLMQQNIPTR